MGILSDIVYGLQISDWILATTLFVIYFIVSLLIVKSIKTANRTHNRAVVALIINGVLLINIWILISPPIVEQTITKVSILTKGTSEQIINKQLQSASNTNPVYHTGLTIPIEQGKSKPFFHMQSLNLPKGTDVTIYGDGISSQQATQFPEQRIQFIASSALSGISKIHWTKKVQLGNSLTIDGHVQLPGIDEYSIEIIDPSDQLISKNNYSENNFLLKVWPKSKGLFNYQIIVKNLQDEIIHQEILPVAVFTKEPPNILILADAPGFEINRLQHFLENQGIPLATRIKLSKDKYQSSFYLLSKISFKESLHLEKFSLLIIDERSWYQLSKTKQQQIYAATKELGLGVLFLLSKQMNEQASNDNSELDNWFQLDKNTSPIVPTVLNFSNIEQKVETDKIILSTIGRQFIQAKRQHILIEDHNGNAVVVYQKIGNGKIGATRLLDSHRLAASKNQKSLYAYWRKLIENLSQSDQLSGDILIANHLPVINDEMIICKSGNSNSELLITSSLATKQQLQTTVISDNQQCARYWPESTGWYQVSVNEIKQAFYVFDKNQWQAARQLLIQQQNYDIANASSEQLEVNLSVPLSSNWLMLSLFLCLGFVWIEQKY